MKKSTLKQMRRAITVFSYAGMMVVSVIFTNGCKKDLRTDQAQQPIVDDASEAVIAHILEFKERMAYYHENPNLKTGGELYSALEAATELENLLNYNFCYTSSNCNQKEYFSSDFIIPLDDLEKINDPKLMDVYYNKVIDTIQAQMGRNNFSTKNLLAVDLEVSGMDSNGDAIVSIGALIGNGQAGVLNNDDWWYGENEGMYPYGQYVPEDAASQLMKRVIDDVIPIPPTGGRWTYTGVVNELIPATQDPLHGGNPDNYRDFKIFYATEAVATITNAQKHLPMAEMSFYESNYIDYALGYETATGMDFSDCNITGGPLFQPVYFIQHNYRMFAGNRHLAMNIGIDDILAY
ncbi:MAG: hypothetical protein KKF98_07390 [Bacteroidetes bacterium]|nr:hypothetical protein [Bacteroidota bacterium]